MYPRVCARVRVSRTVLCNARLDLKIIYNKEILSLSLDDYYLTKKQRVSLSKKIHPLLLTRGVPGTHDTKKLLKHVKCFERSNYPINIPIFDKIGSITFNSVSIVLFEMFIFYCKMALKACKNLIKTTYNGRRCRIDWF